MSFIYGHGEDCHECALRNRDDALRERLQREWEEAAVRCAALYDRDDNPESVIADSAG